MTKELFKRYRPKSLDGVVGNAETVATLRKMVERRAVPHTILFTGPSGCGKTTLARILRRELGCGSADFREMNSADFRGVDTIREVAKNMTLAPIGGKCRVFLLDEVHQLTRDAQEAALKVLEDTPGHVYFFLCTTNPGKLLKTILTRACKLEVKLLKVDEIAGLVRSVAKKEKEPVSDEVVQEIAGACGGSARQALVLLDRVLNLDAEQRVEALQQHEEQETAAIDLCRALIRREKWPRISKVLKEMTDDPEQVRWAVLGFARSVLLGKDASQHYGAYQVICAFENNFYDSKANGLARAAFEATHSDSEE